MIISNYLPLRTSAHPCEAKIHRYDEIRQALQSIHVQTLVDMVGSYNFFDGRMISTTGSPVIDRIDSVGWPSTSSDTKLVEAYIALPSTGSGNVILFISGLP